MRYALILEVKDKKDVDTFREIAEVLTKFSPTAVSLIELEAKHG